MHAARLHKSKRLQRVHDVLEAAKDRWLTTRDIARQSHVLAVSTCVSELRANGAKIDCERRGDIWRYRMVL